MQNDAGQVVVLRRIVDGRDGADALAIEDDFIAGDAEAKGEMFVSGKVVRLRAVCRLYRAVRDNAPLMGAGNSGRYVGVEIFFARLAGGATVARVVVGEEGTIECGAQYGHEDGHDANVDLVVGEMDAGTG